jgi:hypothetical protein
MKFQIIEETALEFTPRGRKSNVEPELVEALKTLPKGKAVKITDMKLNPKTDTFKTDKARVSATIRSAGKQAKVNVKIMWATDGTPQVVVAK